MSSAQANTVATREIEAEPAPSRFARGWHCLGLSRNFKDGNPHRVRAFGQKLRFEYEVDTTHPQEAWRKEAEASLVQRAVHVAR